MDSEQYLRLRNIALKIYNTLNDQKISTTEISYVANVLHALCLHKDIHGEIDAIEDMLRAAEETEEAIKMMQEYA